MVAVIPVVILLLVAAVIYAAVAYQRSLNAAWTAAGDELGLETTRATTLGQPRLRGALGRIAVDVRMTKSGDQTRTRYRVSYPPAPVEFSLRRQTGAQRVLHLFGARDVELGDPAFDDAFVIKTDDAASLAAYLTAARRSSLLRLLAVHGAATITEGRIELQTNAERSSEKLVTVVRRLAATAEQLVGGAATGMIDESMRAREMGELGDALRRLDEAVAHSPDDVDVRLLRAQTAHSAGTSRHEAEDLDVLERLLPADPDVAALRSSAATSESAVAATTDEVDSAALFEEMFGGNRLSFETDDLFTEKYRGRTVTWEGTVRSSRPYDRDLDFGSGPGTKAVIAVASISSDLYGNTEIDAIVSLPAEPGRPLDRHDSVRFTGTLHKVDSMMRNVFVSDARLV